MKKISYQPKFDFLFYIDSVANHDEKKLKREREIKSQPNVLNKEMLKKNESYFNETAGFLKQLSFMQKNTLNLFLYKVDIIIDYLVYLMYSENSFDNLSIQSFNSFLAKVCEVEIHELPKTYEDTLNFVKEHYDSPDSIIDIEKTTNLIIDIVKEPEILENNISKSLNEIYDIFYKIKVEPNLDVINTTMKRHQKILDENPSNFIATLTNDKINPPDVDSSDMEPILTYFSPITLYISICHQRYLYSAELEQLASEKGEQDHYQLLLKFLSDPKRYQMIQMLSKKKWYANELAKEFNITPATMSYHVNKLYGLGLIHVEQGDQNRLYMALDKDRLKLLLNKMQQHLLET